MVHAVGVTEGDGQGSGVADWVGVDWGALPSQRLQTVVRCDLWHAPQWWLWPTDALLIVLPINHHRCHC